MRKLGAGQYNDVYAVSFKESDHWHDYENPDFNSAQEIYKNGRDFFVMLQDADNAAARLGDYIQVGNNTITINGDIKDSQIQQGTYNSSQNMTVSNGFDYKQVLGIITEIQKIVNKYDLVEEFGDNTEQLRLIVKETVEMVEKKEEPLKIKTALKTIRDLAVGVTGSVIATGICTLISQLLI